MQRAPTHPGPSTHARDDSYAATRRRKFTHYAKAGRRDEALALVRECEQSDHAPAPNLALAWTALGDHDRAFHWLDRAYEERLYLLRVVAAKPSYAPLWGDPRYGELMRKMGL